MPSRLGRDVSIHPSMSEPRGPIVRRRRGACIVARPPTHPTWPRWTWGREQGGPSWSHISSTPERHCGRAHPPVDPLGTTPLQRLDAPADGPGVHHVLAQPCPDAPLRPTRCPGVTPYAQTKGWPAAARTSSAPPSRRSCRSAWVLSPRRRGPCSPSRCCSGRGPGPLHDDNASSQWSQPFSWHL